jgi:enamine deaminase RidA (YjgF/YER057c/UK114 family)
VTEEVKAQAQQAVQGTQQVAGQAAEGAKQQAVSVLSTQKHQAAHSLSAMSDALEQAGQSMRDQNLGYAGEAMDRAASQIDRVAGYLHENDVNDIVRDFENFGRRSPTLFLGGAFALGLLAARFLKSSPPPQAPPQGSQYYRAGGNNSYAYGGYETGYSPSAAQPQGSYNSGEVPYRYEDVGGVPYVERRYAPSMMDETTDINVDEMPDLSTGTEEGSYGNTVQ